MPRYIFEQFAAVCNQADLSFSPDGKWVAYSTNVSGQFNIWRQPVETSPDGTPHMPKPARSHASLQPLPQVVAQARLQLQ